MSKFKHCCVAGLLSVLAATALAQSSDAGSARLEGDVGLGVFSRQAIVRGESNDASVLPYVFATYGRLFGRIDTFGVKTLQVGYGHLEISTRVLQDGLQANAATAGIVERKASLPLGVSTFQITPWGAFGLMALRDLRESDGLIVDANWTGKVQLASWLTVFPQFGAEHFSARYVDYQYGVRPGEGSFSPYKASAALNPYLALYTDTPISSDVFLQLSWRQKWLDRAISDSPLVAESRRWNAFAAVTWRFR
jgi:MipA family protein